VVSTRLKKNNVYTVALLHVCGSKKVSRAQNIDAYYLSYWRLCTSYNTCNIRDCTARCRNTKGGFSLHKNTFLRLIGIRGKLTWYTRKFVRSYHTYHHDDESSSTISVRTVSNLTDSTDYKFKSLIMLYYKYIVLKVNRSVLILYYGSLAKL